MDVRVEFGDGPLVDVEEVAQRVEAPGIGLWQLGRSSWAEPTGRIPFLAMTTEIEKAVGDRTDPGQIRACLRR